MRKIAIATAVALIAMSGAVSAGNLQGQGQQMFDDTDATSLSVVDSRDMSRTKVDGDDYPVAQAWAAPLTSSNDTCMGSSSAGGQAATFGVSIATTWRDGDCVRRKDARLLHNMGLNGPAAALMCQKDNIAAAFEAAGVPCSNPNLPAPVDKAIVAPVVVDELGESDVDIQESQFNAWDDHGFIH